MHLMDWEGAVLLPSADDLAAASSSEASNRSAISNATAPWLGCIVAPGALLGGDVVGVLNGVATPEQCCHACRADSQPCNVWNHCGLVDGCRWGRVDAWAELHPAERSGGVKVVGLGIKCMMSQLV